MNKHLWRLPPGVKVWVVKDDCANCGGFGRTTEYPGEEKTEVWCDCLVEYVIDVEGKPRPNIDLNLDE